MRRNLQLDFLRFCGIMLVMVHHLPVFTDNLFGRVLQKIQLGGWIGVDLFFVLSGYLVSGLIIKEYQNSGKFDTKRFLIRRGLKIYPAFYFYLLYQFGFNAFFTNHPQSLGGLFDEAIFLSNYLDHNNDHLWSICVEEHFYFLLALLFYLLIRYRNLNMRSVILIYAFLLIFGLFFRYLNYSIYSDYNFSRDYARSHIRFDGLFYGVFISYIAHFRPQIIDKLIADKMKIVWIAIALVFLSSNFIFRREDQRLISVVNLAINPVCFGYLMIVCINFNNQIFLKVIKPMSYIGMYSYSIYLFHKHFIQINNKIFDVGTPVFYTCYFASALLGGVVISKVIEYPVLRFREKIFPSKSTSAA